MDVPFLDLKRHNQPLMPHFLDALTDVMDSDSLVLGASVEQFERNFAAYIGTRYALGVGSGADALEIILRACGIGPGDEVIVPANSFVATATAVSLTGAQPVFCDVEANALVSLRTAKKALTHRTKAIIPVHLYGQCIAMEEISSWAKTHDLKVIEDACQAHGAGHLGRRAGTLGDAAAFSFYPTKNLGALGDGGAITSNDSDLVQKMRLWRNYGSTKKYEHSLWGKNSRLDSLQASFLNIKLGNLQEVTEQRRAAAAELAAGLQNLPFEVKASDGFDKHACHLFVIDLEQASDRQALQAHLQRLGVQTLIHYPIPIHKQVAYASHGNLSFPEAERLCASVVSLPLFVGITSQEIRHVIASVRSFWEHR